jgi:hypothetical protein
MSLCLEAITLPVASFCACLDGIKGGISIKKDVKKADIAMIDQYQLPKSRGGQPGSYTDGAWISPRRAIPRHEGLGTDIIEHLWRAGQEARVRYHLAAGGFSD